MVVVERDGGSTMLDKGHRGLHSDRVRGVRDPTALSVDLDAVRADKGRGETSGYEGVGKQMRW